MLPALTTRGIKVKSSQPTPPLFSSANNLRPFHSSTLSLKDKSSNNNNNDTSNSIVNSNNSLSTNNTWKPTFSFNGVDPKILPVGSRSYRLIEKEPWASARIFGRAPPGWNPESVRSGEKIMARMSKGQIISEYYDNDVPVRKRVDQSPLIIR